MTTQLMRSARSYWRKCRLNTYFAHTFDGEGFSALASIGGARQPRIVYGSSVLVSVRHRN
jgi:hypothetical protein